MTEPSERPFEVNEDPLAVDARFSYVRGYITALENMVRGIDKIRAETPDEEQNLLLFKVQDQALVAWDAALNTLKALESLRTGRDQP